MSLRLLTIASCVVAAQVTALELPRAERQRHPLEVPPKPVVAEDARPFYDDPGANGITLDGHEEPVVPYALLTISFPEEMVSAGVVDAPDAESPIVFWPPLNGEFTWRTPRSGEFIVKGPVIPGTQYRIRLREGLQDADGNALAVDEWGALASSPPLRLVWCGVGERDSIAARPQVPLDFNYAIDLETAASACWFQERETGRRHPAELLLNMPEGSADAPVVPAAEMPEGVSFFRVRPVAPLPPGVFFDLVVDGIVSAAGGKGLRYPVVVALGRTNPLSVEYVAARAFPREKPRIVVKFSDNLSDAPLPEGALGISPPVANLGFRKAGPELIAEGDFSVPGKYAVTVSPEIVGERGFGLPKAERWGATFRQPRPAVLFPDRELRMRGADGVNFSLVQFHTGPLEWSLAAVPPGRLAEVRSRLREFDAVLEDEDGRRRRGEDGLFAQPPTEPLAEALGLQILASGSLPAADGEELRIIRWKPEKGRHPSGPVLLEAKGPAPDGRLVGNRALIFFSDLAITRKREPARDVLRVADLADALPVPGARLELLDAAGVPFASATTGADGTASFDAAVFAGCAYAVARKGEEAGWQPLALASRFPGASPPYGGIPSLRGYSFTDRPLYRPGHTVYFKGFLRQISDGEPRIPRARTVQWRIEAPYSREAVASGEARLDEWGAWDASWEVPARGRTGEFYLRASLDGQEAGMLTPFRVEEFRSPPFSVICEPGSPRGPGEASVEIDSRLFHGAPNAGARVRWRALWTSDSDGGFYIGAVGDEMVRVDLSSESATRPEYSASVEGETVLDPSGRATVSVPAPFTDPGNRARANVFWRIDVTGADGQTVTGGLTQVVNMHSVLYGIRARDAEPGRAEFEWDAREPFAAAGQPVLSLFRVTTRSVKERIAPNVYRFRNADAFERVATLNPASPGQVRFENLAPGRYVAVLDPPKGGAGQRVSVETYVAGPGEAPLPVEAETAARVVSLSGGDASRPWTVGGNGSVSIQAPSPGVAWVSIETDRILDSFTLPLEGNSARIELPVKASYEPNAFLSVYLLRPGGPTGLAGEMFGWMGFEAAREDRRIEVSIETASPRVEPRQRITGKVRASAGGRPLAGADLAVYAVDDAILELGAWELPDGYFDAIEPRRDYSVLTYSALEAFVDATPSAWLTSKGYVVGGAGEEEFSSTQLLRKEFKPLILWEPSLKTDARGEAEFSCEAPDNLTRYRFVAVAQSKAGQFGAASSLVEVAKDLTIEPALPRFLREGDALDLRAVARQTAADLVPVAVRCAVRGSISLAGSNKESAELARGVPVPVAFSATVGEPGEADVEFRVRSADGQLADAVIVSIPVLSATAQVRESVAARWDGSAFDPEAMLPDGWRERRGTRSVTISTTPDLTRLAAIPMLLAYPHGCFEQKSSRLLVYTRLARLLPYLPLADPTPASYGSTIIETLGEFEAALLPDGFLPYWPGGATPSPFVTLQAAWCVAAAEAEGFPVPERLASALPEAAREILRGGVKEATPGLRAFALFVLCQSDPSAEELEATASELYLERDRLGIDGKAWLLLSLAAMGKREDARARLASELAVGGGGPGFHPVTFASPRRSDMLARWARAVANPRAAGEELDQIAAEASGFSTQEALWSLLAFESRLRAGRWPAIPNTVKPAPLRRSTNGSAAVWESGDGLPAISGLPATRAPGSWLAEGTFDLDPDAGPADQGFRIERIVKNLTDPRRDGSGANPFRLGDELLISFRFAANAPAHFVAIEAPLPACFEPLNPAVARHGEAAPDDASRPAAPSHYEFRDSRVDLYLDELPEGPASVSVIARVTSSGDFSWPATMISPMYAPTTWGRTASARVRAIP